MTTLLGNSSQYEGPTAPQLLPDSRDASLEWARRLRADRQERRLEQGVVRFRDKNLLSSDWNVVAITWPVTVDVESFLLVGPSGLFATTVADHGRSRVLLAGDEVQINGKRLRYIEQARHAARRATQAMSDAAGLYVPVTPVLNFEGSGVISVHGLPKECLVATSRELDRLVNLRGSRISASTAAKLAAIAARPDTWAKSGTEADRTGYRWFGKEDALLTDKKTHKDSQPSAVAE